MTNAVPIRIADAVAAEINSAVAAESFQTLGFTAVRSYADWDEDFSDLSDMVVDVVYMTHQPPGSVELESVGYLAYQPSVDVAIRKRFGPSDRAEATGRLKNTSVDPLVTLLQELHELFVSTRKTIPLDDEVEALWMQSDVMSWVNQQKLREGLFEGWVRVKFDVRKAI